MLSRVRWSPVIIGPAGPSIAEIYGHPSSCVIARSPTTAAPARRRARAASLRSTAPVFISKLHLIFITRRQFIGRHGWYPRTVHDDMDGPPGPSMSSWTVRGGPSMSSWTVRGDHPCRHGRSGGTAFGGDQLMRDSAIQNRQCRTRLRPPNTIASLLRANLSF